MNTKCYGLYIIDAQDVVQHGYQSPNQLLCFRDCESCNNYIIDLLRKLPASPSPVDIPFTFGVYVINDAPAGFYKALADNAGRVTYSTEQMTLGVDRFDISQDYLHNSLGVFGTPESKEHSALATQRFETTLKNRMQALQSLTNAINNLPESRQRSLDLNSCKLGLQHLYGADGMAHKPIIEPDWYMQYLKSMLLCMKANCAADINQYSVELSDAYKNEYRNREADAYDKNLSHAQLLHSSMEAAVTRFIERNQNIGVPPEELEQLKQYVGVALQNLAENMRDTDHPNYRNNYIELMATDVPLKEKYLFKTLCNNFIDEYVKQSPYAKLFVNCAKGVSSACNIMIQIEKEKGYQYNVALYAEIQDDAINTMNSEQDVPDIQ